MLALLVAAVVEVPELGALVLRVPLAEAVAEGEDPLLGPRLLLVAAAAAEDGVEAVLLDPLEQGDGLVAVAAFEFVADLDPAGVDLVLDRGDDQPQAQLGDERSRNSITSGKLCPVSTCMIGNGTGAGANAFCARCSISTESLPPEKSITGCSNSATTSRMMWIDSASSVSRSDSSTPARARGRSGPQR